MMGSEAELYRSASAAREVAERRERDRRRALVVLCARFLASHGFDEACERLSAASGVSLSKVDAADNVDLTRILGEWEEQQEARWGRRPQLTRALVRKVPPGGGGRRDAPAASASGTAAAERGGPDHGGGITAGSRLVSNCFSGQMAARQRREKAAAAAAASAAVASEHPNPAKPPTIAKDSTGKAPAAGGGRDTSSIRGGSGGSDVPPQTSDAAADQLNPGGGRDSAWGATADGGLFAVQGRSCRERSRQGGPVAQGEASEDDPLDFLAEHLLKPLPASLQGELRDLARAVLRDACAERPTTAWGDIAGLEDAKRLLHEAIVLPAKYPELFTGLLSPWRGVLLYGPPGTGKTLLAKAVAAQCRTTFFNVSASTLISKWRGDSEKIVRVLFELARHFAPSTIFLDEVDAIMGARGVQGEHEASRRMKTELLVQLDGLARRADERVFVLAATNMPWELDMALLRRLEKRILVALPGRGARLSMLNSLLAGRCIPSICGSSGSAPSGCTTADAACNLDLEAAADATEGFSGSDIAVLAKEAAMRPLRRLMLALEPEIGCGEGMSGARAQAPQALEAARSGKRSTSSGGPGGIEPSRLLGPVTAADMVAAIAATRPTGGAFAEEYASFAKQYGQVL